MLHYGLCFLVTTVQRSEGIMPVVDRAMKWVAPIPVHESLTTEGAADLFLQWVVQCCGMLQLIIADHYPLFMSAFW